LVAVMAYFAVAVIGNILAWWWGWKTARHWARPFADSRVWSTGSN